MRAVGEEQYKKVCKNTVGQFKSWLSKNATTELTKSVQDVYLFQEEMDGPNTPGGRPPLYSEPPSYGEEDGSTPTGQPSNSSHIRLLTSVDEPEMRPYVQTAHYQPQPLFQSESHPNNLLARPLAVKL